VCALSSPRAAQSSAILCYVTDRRSLSVAASSDAVSTLLAKIGAAAAAGVDWVQLRVKDLPADRVASLTRQALARTAHVSDGRQRTRILVNDRLDIALTEAAGGVHLGERSLPVKEAKRLIELRSSGADFIVGASCHSLQAAESAARDGADYLIFGPVFATPSKAAFGAPQGLDMLARVCRAVTIPVLAIGGISPENASACLNAGASGVAAIRLFQEAADLTGLVASLRQRSR
jgi:thiamine-phosphate pyrophosphorylase